jgi:hypothetical protein
MEDWNAYRRRQRAVATAKRQAETGFKRGPCPTHAARMKALWADPEWRARQVAAMQGKKKGSRSRTTPEQQAATAQPDEGHVRCLWPRPSG